MHFLSSLICDGKQDLPLGPNNVLKNGKAYKTLLKIIDKTSNYITLKCFELVIIFKNDYRSGTVNSKSFVGKVLLRIKWKFELTYAL